jgi:eukaryotic translation initiation factor 2-alpha kinase 4
MQLTAYGATVQVQNAFQAGMPILAVDVLPVIFDAMTKNSVWITDDEAWKLLLSSFPSSQIAYASQIREAAAKYKAEHPYILLFAVREERVQLLAL